MIIYKYSMKQIAIKNMIFAIGLCLSEIGLESMPNEKQLAVPACTEALNEGG